jgi:tetratricopeptide (TPR) repeat protein
MNADKLGFGDDLAAFADSVIGAGLSPQVMALLAQAAGLYEQPQQALALLEQARAQAPRHPGPLIALYRFHFYGHRLEQARAAGEDALAIARTALGPDFGDVAPSEEATRFDAAVRFYLFVIKGLAYLNLRLGELDEARLMLVALRHLDPKDIVGGGLLSHVLARHEAGGPHEHSPDYPVRGWSATL